MIIYIIIHLITILINKKLIDLADRKVNIKDYLILIIFSPVILIINYINLSRYCKIKRDYDLRNKLSIIIVKYISLLILSICIEEVILYII